PAEERELDDEVHADDAAAQLLDEARDGLDRAAGREHVVVNDHAGPPRDRVRVHLEGVLALLEGVARRDRPRRQLPGPPRRDEPAPDLARDGGAEPEPTRLRAEHEVR